MEHEFSSHTLAIENPHLLLISEHQMSCIAEGDSSLYPKTYKPLKIIPATKCKTSGRGSNGFAIYIKENLDPNIDIKVQQFDSHWCLLELSQKNETQVIILYAYIRSPSKNNPQIANETIKNVTEKIADVTENTTAPLIILGDLNARMGEVVGDTEWNDKGIELWEIFNRAKVKILNSQLEKFEPTFHSDVDNSTSIVDLACVNEAAEQKVKNIKIGAHSAAISDHTPIILELNPQIVETIKLKEPTFKIFFTKKKEKEFQQALKTRMSKMLKKVNHDLVTTEIMTNQNEKATNAISEWLFFLHIFNWKMSAIETFGITKILDKKCHKIDTKLWQLETKISKLKNSPTKNLNLISKLTKQKEIRKLQLSNEYWNHIVKKIESKGPEKVLTSELRKISTCKERQIALKSAKGTIETKPEEVGKIFREHLCKILQEPLEFASTPRQLRISEEFKQLHERNDKGPKSLNQPFKTREIKIVIEGLKNGKEPGFDGISYELVKMAKGPGLKYLLSLYKVWWKTAHIPTIVKHSAVTMHFKGNGKNPKDAHSYRAIALMICWLKIFEGVVKNRIESFATEHELISKYQGGFQRHKGTIEQLFNLKILLKTNPERHVAFLDLEQAFDTVWRTGLLVTVHRRGIQGPIWKVLNSLYHDTSACIKLDSGTTKSFQTTRGVLQGSLLSPTLFNIFINTLAVKLSPSPGLKLGKQNVPLLMYCDDIGLLTNSAKGLQDSIDQSAEVANDLNLKFNPQKCKIMTNSLFRTKIYMKSGNTSKTLEHVTSYKYLGIEIDANGNATENYWKQAIKTFKRRVGWIKYLSKLHPISVKHARMVFNLSAKPVLEYALQIFSPTKEINTKIEKTLLSSVASTLESVFTQKMRLKESYLD